MIMQQPKTGKGVIIGANVEFGRDVVVWNYVVIGDNTKIGDGTCIGSFCDIGKNVVIGKNCNIQAHVTISNECVLGDSVFIAPNSSLLNDKYPKSNLLTAPIVKDNVIIGGGVTILPQVVLGESSVIGGGSVVTTNVPPEKVFMGVPAKEVMSKEEYETKREAFIRKKQGKR
jgi:acetyltransferase-like isoleucine patch superfamily enzyme